MAIFIEQDLKSDAVYTEQVVSALAEQVVAVRYWPAGQVVAVVAEQDMMVVAQAVKSCTGQAEHWPASVGVVSA